MIIVGLKGGLGNQLFQFANAFSIGRDLKKTVFGDFEYFQQEEKNTTRLYSLNQLGVTLSPAPTDLTRKIAGLSLAKKFKRAIAKTGFYQLGSYYGEVSPFDYCPLTKFPGSVYCDGYRQSFKYFNHYQNELSQQFSLNPSAQELTVAMHVRRGDYVNHSTHPTLSLEYYSAAYLQLLREKIGWHKLNVYSDDIAWCQKTLPRTHLFSEANFISFGNPIDDFKHMASSHHFIIANSTFSWWAAWLGKANDKIVFAPSNWINHKSFSIKTFFPPGWRIL